jgi:hypothetical protein
MMGETFFITGTNVVVGQLQATDGVVGDLQKTKNLRHAFSASEIESALCEAFGTKEIEGISDVLLLPRNKKQGKARHKVFVVLGTHDIRRDRRVIQLMNQFDDVDYDLVPQISQGMIPSEAKSVL